MTFEAPMSSQRDVDEDRQQYSFRQYGIVVYLTIWAWRALNPQLFFASILMWLTRWLGWFSEHPITPGLRRSLAPPPPSSPFSTSTPATPSYSHSSATTFPSTPTTPQPTPIMPAAYIAPPTSPLKSPTSYTFTSLVSRSQTVADLRPFNAEAPTVPSTLFLGLYRDEGDQYLAASQSPSDCIDDRAMTDPDLAHHLHETALARASSILSTLRASPHALDGLRKLVFRDPHYSDKSSSIAAEAVTSEIFSRLHYHQVESAGGIQDIVLEDVDFGELDTYYPQTALPLGLLIKGNSSLTSLRLSSCTIPWQLLSNLPSLMDLSLTSVSVLEGTYTPDASLPRAPFKTPLRRLAFQNSTDLIRKLVFGPQEGHCIAWRECVELEVDLGSEASRALSWVIVHECAARVERLGVRWEGNSDDEGSYSSGSDDEDTFTLSNLHLPMLHKQRDWKHTILKVASKLSSATSISLWNTANLKEPRSRSSLGRSFPPIKPRRSISNPIFLSLFTCKADLATKYHSEVAVGLPGSCIRMDTKFFGLTSAGQGLVLRFLRTPFPPIFKLPAKPPTTLSTSSHVIS